jgi:hypothetical protein
MPSRALGLWIPGSRKRAPRNDERWVLFYALRDEDASPIESVLETISTDCCPTGQIADSLSSPIRKNIPVLFLPKSLP